jgi:putative two-component system response regulator
MGDRQATHDVLIVDDEEDNRVAYERTLSSRGYSCLDAPDAKTARSMLDKDEYRLVLLDINMPGESGLDLLTHIRTTYPATAVVMVTGVDDPDQAMRAVETGAFGYMVKPVRSTELILSVANALLRRAVEAEARFTMRRLESIVQTRTKELVAALESLQHSQSETISRLAKLVEFRDEDTGRHVERMSNYCGMIAGRMGLPVGRAMTMQLASQLHDVGKVSIPDGILFKPGKLSATEFEVMKGHAEAGYQMLAGSESEVVQLGAVIALTHHERWDGTGYPKQLAGEDIPVEGRIAAVADVYDALTSRRSYRAAFPVGIAIEKIRGEGGRHFDPAILNTFLGSLTEVDRIRQKFED